MKIYWIWLLLHVISWFFALSHYFGNMDDLLWRLAGVVLYFIIFFFMPLLNERPLTRVTALSINSLLTILVLFPTPATGFTIYLLFIISLLMSEAFFTLSKHFAAIVAGINIVGMAIILFTTEHHQIPIPFLIIYFILFFAGIILFKQTKDNFDDSQARNDALLREYRTAKRRLLSEDNLARQEERVLIGHEIHDSVGHKLTALLMQLEAFRLRASTQDEPHVASLKKLAADSLEETRSAVKSIKRNDVGGLPGVLRLIRKLETESFIRIHFSVKHGAFAAPLTGEQSFAIYRCVQEGLTNIMKHSHAREADIQFEAPGGSVFRFELSNPMKEARKFQEGFGISSMRARLENLDGQLDVEQTDDTFFIRGSIPLVNKEGHDDTNFTS